MAQSRSSKGQAAAKKPAAAKTDKPDETPATGGVGEPTTDDANTGILQEQEVADEPTPDAPVVAVDPRTSGQDPDESTGPVDVATSPEPPAVEVDERTGIGSSDIPEKVVLETVHPERLAEANGSEFSEGGGGVPGDVQSATVFPLPGDQIKATGGTVMLADGTSGPPEVATRAAQDPSAAPLTAPDTGRVTGPAPVPQYVALTPAASQSLHHEHTGFVDDDGKSVNLSRAAKKVEGSDTVVVTTKRVYETFPLPGAPDQVGQRLLFPEGVEMAKARFDLMVDDSKARAEAES